MQFFLQRLQEGSWTARDSFLLVQVIKEYPDASRAAGSAITLRPSLDITLGGNELLWLTVHLVRISGLDA